MRRALKPGVLGAARFLDFDGVRVARLRLDRWWDATLTIGPNGWPADDRYRPLVVIGMNPSDAGAEWDDPTSAKCTTFARREVPIGANGLVMVNLHPGISTDPDELHAVRLPYGAHDEHWDRVAGALAENAVAFVAGWGKDLRAFRAHATMTWSERIARVKDIASDTGVALQCYGANKDGSPKHPLYLKGTTPLVPWWAR